MAPKPDHHLPEVDTSLWESTWGQPDGPSVEVAYIGTTGTFLSERNDLLSGKREYSMPKLMHHVPLSMRGPYKIDSDVGLLGERRNTAGWAMCNGIVSGENRRANPDGQDRPCKAKAINRSGLCSRHGGMLHPLDKKKINWELAPREVRWRYGKLPVDELNDEELSRGQIQREDGTWTNNPSVPIEVHDEMVRKLFERADRRLQENLLDTVDSITEIAKGMAYEPADRLKAATWVFERLRGKVPTEIKIGVDKPFESILTEMMTGGSRAESRARRGVIEDAIDAEVVDQDEFLADLDEGQEPEEVEEEIVEVDTSPPEDHIPLRANWVPQPPVLTGPAGKPERSPLPPKDMEQRQRWERDAEEERQKAAAKRKEFLEKMRAQKAKRIAVRNEGHAQMPIPFKTEHVEYADDPGAHYIVFEKP